MGILCLNSQLLCPVAHLVADGNVDTHVVIMKLQNDENLFFFPLTLGVPEPMRVNFFGSLHFPLCLCVNW